MRIQIFGARCIPARWGGFDNTATELATRFAERGDEVTVYVMARYALPERPRTYQGVRLVYLPTIYGKYLETPIHEALAALVGLFRGADVDYVLGCRTSLAYLPYRALGRRVVFNTDGLDFERRKWGRFSRAYLRSSYWIASRLATHLVHDNTHIKDYFLTHFGRSGAFISIGGTPFRSASPAVVRRYGVEPGGYYLVACRLEPENNIQEIVEGFVRSGSQRQLLIAGGANYDSDYVRSLSRVADPRVRMIGPVYRDNDIEELHYHAFAYLHGHAVGGTNPSLLKAMACGNLIVANGTPYNREVLGEGGGVYFHPDPAEIAERIAYVERHRDELEPMRAAGFSRLQRYYTWDLSADLHRAFFEWLRGAREGFQETFG